MPNNQEPYSQTVSDVSVATQGYDVGDASSLSSTQYAPVLSGGTPALLAAPSDTPNQSESLQYISDPTVLSSAEATGATPGQAGSWNPSGDSQIVPSGNGLTTNSGLTQTSSQTPSVFDADTLAGRSTPFISPTGDLNLVTTGDVQVYSGADIRIMIDLPNVPQTGASKAQYSKQLFETTTLTVSVHRATSQVRALGYINPKGFAMGGRTIAGTLILTQFVADALVTFLQSVLTSETSKDTSYTKVDQLPAFNITMLFTNEEGYASYRRLIGVKMVTDGVTMSIQDMLTERVISYLAQDFTPLLPLNASNKYQSQTGDGTQHETTPADVASQYDPSTGTSTSSAPPDLSVATDSVETFI